MIGSTTRYRRWYWLPYGSDDHTFRIRLIMQLSKGRCALHTLLVKLFDRTRQRAKDIASVVRSEHFFARTFGMRHHAENIAVLIAYARNV
jgi:hypothetical protein